MGSNFDLNISLFCNGKSKSKKEFKPRILADSGGFLFAGLFLFLIVLGVGLGVK